MGLGLGGSLGFLPFFQQGTYFMAYVDSTMSELLVGNPFSIKRVRVEALTPTSIGNQGGTSVNTHQPGFPHNTSPTPVFMVPPYSSGTTRVVHASHMAEERPRINGRLQIVCRGLHTMAVLA